MNNPKKANRRRLPRLSVAVKALGIKPDPLKELALGNYHHRGSISESGS